VLLPFGASGFAGTRWMIHPTMHTDQSDPDRVKYGSLIQPAQNATELDQRVAAETG
jgi:hypothetical protein